jgi:hypothetical protein
LICNAADADGITEAMAKTTRENTRHPEPILFINILVILYNSPYSLGILHLAEIAKLGIPPFL